MYKDYQGNQQIFVYLSEKSKLERPIEEKIKCSLQYSKKKKEEKSLLKAIHIRRILRVESHINEIFYLRIAIQNFQYSFRFYVFKIFHITSGKIALA